MIIIQHDGQQGTPSVSLSLAGSAFVMSLSEDIGDRRVFIPSTKAEPCNLPRSLPSHPLPHWNRIDQWASFRRVPARLRSSASSAAAAARLLTEKNCIKI